MSKMYLSVSIFIILLLIVSCGQEKIDALIAENENLKSRIASLEEENHLLKETDQNYFSKAINTQNSANNKSSYLNAIDKFTQLIDKFPHSQYVPEARKQILNLNKLITNIDKYNSTKVKFDIALAEHNIKEARRHLSTLKNLVPADDYKLFQKKLDREINKPLQTTINKLVSEFGSFKTNYQIIKMLEYKGIFVKFEATFTSVDRSRHMITAYSSGWAEGSSLEIFYDGVNMEEYFTTNDPQCCDNRYVVTGKTDLYSNTHDLFIYAEEIEVIQH